MGAQRAVLTALLLALVVLPAALGAPEYYYWNQLTGDVQWEDPGSVPAHGKDGRRVWLAADGTPLDADPHAMEFKWVESWSEEHQRPFFYNQETKQSTWERPADLAWRRVEVQAPEIL